MSQIWNEMRQLIGRDCIPDTEELSRTWPHNYILPWYRLPVMAAINQAAVTKSLFEIETGGPAHRRQPGVDAFAAVPILNANGEIVDRSGTAQDVHHPQESGEGTKKAP
jgi:hypothetical protein